MHLAGLPSEEKRIKEQFSLFAEWFSMEQAENPFSLGYKMNKMGELLCEKVTLKIPDYDLSGIYPRSEIISFTARARLPFSQLSLQFHDFQISFPDSETARVTVTGRITGKRVSEEKMEETRELEWILKKAEKEWRFSGMEVTEVLKK